MDKILLIGVIALLAVSLIGAGLFVANTTTSVSAEEPKNCGSCDGSCSSGSSCGASSCQMKAEGSCGCSKKT